MGERDGVAVSLVEGVAVGAAVGEGVMEEDEVDMEEDKVVLEKFSESEEDMSENISVKLRNIYTIRGTVPSPSVN